MKATTNPPVREYLAGEWVTYTPTRFERRRHVPLVKVLGPAPMREADHLRMAAYQVRVRR